MLKNKQFNGQLFPGVIHQKAQRVNVPERGIIYDRPERYVVNTSFGQMEIAVGDWFVEFPSGNCYVFKPADMATLGYQPAKPKNKWWKL